MTFGTTEWTSELQRIIGTDMDVMEHELAWPKLKDSVTPAALGGSLYWSDETFFLSGY